MHQGRVDELARVIGVREAAQPGVDDEVEQVVSVAQFDPVFPTSPCRDGYGLLYEGTVGDFQFDGQVPHGESDTGGQQVHEVHRDALVGCIASGVLGLDSLPWAPLGPHRERKESKPQQRQHHTTHRAPTKNSGLKQYGASTGANQPGPLCPGIYTAADVAMRRCLS